MDAHTRESAVTPAESKTIEGQRLTALFGAVAALPAAALVAKGPEGAPLFVMAITHPVNAVRAAFIVQDAGGAGCFDFGLAMINPGSEAAPFVDSETSASFAATLIDHQEALIDLESGKASAEDLQQISVDLSGLNGEVSAAVGRLDQAEVDLRGKASATALEEVEARTTTAEAGVIDLEIALATEAGARADAINQLSARQAVRPNHVPNGGLADGARGWLLNAGAVGVANPVRGRVITANAANWSALSAPFPVFGGETYFVGASLLSQRNGGWMGVRLRYFSDAAAQVDGPGQSIANGAEIAGAGEQRKSIGSVAPANAIRARADIYAYAGSGGYSDAGMVMVNTGTVAAPFNDMTTDAEISATVTDQSLAIIDLENQHAIASWYKVADAAGGKPTRIGLQSSAFGNFIALEAEQVYFGENTVIDTASQTQQGVWGSTRRVIANDPPVGPDNLIHWAGPSNIGLGSMTKANAGFWQDQSGAYGPLPAPLFWAKVTPTQISRSRTGAGPISTALNDVIVTCYTGTSGATCTWSRVSGDTSISYPSTGFTPVFNTTLAAGQTKTALFVGLVAKGGDVDLVYVNVEFSDNV